MKTILTWAGVIAGAIALVAVLPGGFVLGHGFHPGLMPIAFVGVTFNKHYQFVEDLAKKVHNLSADALTYAIANTVPVNTNTVLAKFRRIRTVDNSSHRKDAHTRSGFVR